MCFQNTHKTVLLETFNLVEVGITQQFCRNDETSVYQFRFFLVDFGFNC